MSFMGCKIRSCTPGAKSALGAPLIDKTSNKTAADKYRPLNR